MRAAPASALHRAWKWPVAIALASVVGLISALVGNGPWDALSWIALAIPVAVSAVTLWRRNGRRG